MALAGGNALGAFQAGALAELTRRGRHARLVAGTSIGAVNAVLYLSPKDGDPVGTLQTFWDSLAQDVFAWSRQQRERVAGLQTLLLGRPNLSRSRAPAAVAPFTAMPSLQDSAPLADTLAKLVDFDALPSRAHLILASVQLDPDRGVFFDSADTPLRVEHVLASAALPVFFPPVRIGDHAYVDGGLAANLPIEPLLGGDDPLDCIALDLVSGEGPAPASLSDAAERAQDALFAVQSDRALHEVERATRPIRVLYVPFRPKNPDSALKSFDFSRSSLRERWRAGEDAMTRALDALDKSCSQRPVVERL